MRSSRPDGALLLKMEKPLTKENVAEHAASLAEALEGLSPGDALCVESPHPEGPDASGLALVLAAARECQARSVEMRLRWPKALSEFAEDLRLARHLVVESLEGLK